MRKENAKFRSDGDATRQALIDAAGILAARHGWSNVKAKDVCELAGVSAASVNYWFGSRSALYREVVRQIPEGVLDYDTENKILDNPDQIAALREGLLHVMMQKPGRGRWHLALWAREMFAGPSEEFMRLLRERGQVRVGSFRRFLAAYLGIPDQGAEIESVLLSAMAPCAWVMALTPEVQQTLWEGLDGMEGRKVLVETVIGNLERMKRERVAEGSIRKASGKSVVK